MMLSYSELIERFQDVLGTPKPLIEETYNKPDVTDIVMGRYISTRKFGDFHMLIVFQMDGRVVKFTNAYRIYPQLIHNIDVDALKPVDVLKEFMNIYGIDKDIPGFGKKKFFVEKNARDIFLGILDIEKYVEAMKNIENSAK